LGAFLEIFKYLLVSTNFGASSKYFQNDDKSLYRRGRTETRKPGPNDEEMIDGWPGGYFSFPLPLFPLILANKQKKNNFGTAKVADARQDLSPAPDT